MALKKSPKKLLLITAHHRKNKKPKNQYCYHTFTKENVKGLWKKNFENQLANEKNEKINNPKDTIMQNYD